MKILIGAVVGAVVMFIWGFAAHMVTPLGQAGWKRLPDEPAVRTALKESIPEPGLYMFPGHEPDAPREEVEAAMADWAKGPSGILIWHPAGADAMSGKQLGM